jgi:ribonuclease BN (tRNA processing enzyme)
LCEAAIQGIRDADTYPYHLTAFEAGEIAAATGAHELVLTHISSRLDPQLSIDQAAGAFVGPISYAAPATTFAVPTRE